MRLTCLSIFLLLVRVRIFSQSLFLGPGVNYNGYINNVYYVGNANVDRIKPGFSLNTVMWDWNLRKKHSGLKLGYVVEEMSVHSNVSNQKAGWYSNWDARVRKQLILFNAYPLWVPMGKRIEMRFGYMISFLHWARVDGTYESIWHRPGQTSSYDTFSGVTSKYTVRLGIGPSLNMNWTLFKIRQSRVKLNYSLSYNFLPEVVASQNRFHPLRSQFELHIELPLFSAEQKMDMELRRQYFMDKKAARKENKKVRRNRSS